jgi:hypothetical protein
MVDQECTVIPPFIRRLMPNATEGELLDATEVFKRYVQIVIAIYERTTEEETGSIRTKTVLDVD